MEQHHDVDRHVRMAADALIAAGLALFVAHVALGGNITLPTESPSLLDALLAAGIVTHFARVFAAWWTSP